VPLDGPVHTDLSAVSDGALEVYCEDPAANQASLREEWQTLEKRARPGVFLSWQWIGVWLSVYQPAFKVLKVMDQGQLVGLGLVTESSERRHGILSSRCLYVHQTGCPSQDQIWIEYNGFLAKTGMELLVAEACVDYLKRLRAGWDEFVIGAVDTDYARALAKVSALIPHIRWEAPCFGVDLALLRSRDQAYLDSLSGNTRHQIRRTLKLYRQQGPVCLERPQTTEEAESLFDQCAPYHLQRWGGSIGESGFANPDFVRFHKRYVRTHWERGGADLIVLKVGGSTLAIFYNLIYQNRVYFYLAGIKAEADNKLKPGLLGHSLCITDYIERGFEYYDFMGGEERYKRQLASPSTHLVQVALQQDRWKLRAEQTLRTIKRRWSRKPL
jgi:CelD/BcsL family acetyltransferase involved in cellulose biosynthesis